VVRCAHCGSSCRDDARFCGVCGKAVAATEPSLVGRLPPAQATPDLAGREISGRYRIQTKLGEGGMGAVYRAEQISLKRRCAVKLLRPELSADAGLVRRFNAEAELAAKLSHPNTVNIYDFGQDVDGTLFIAMEYIEGRSLRQVMNAEGPLPPKRALAIAHQVAASLADAHSHGIVHRDLKPDNVMLAERGKDKDIVRVLDFGIAKLRDDHARTSLNMHTQAGDLVGTPQYMAPEQIRGEAVDGRTDVYALGAIVYEMMTARLPLEGPSVMVILSRHLLDTPEPPSRRRPDLGLPPAVDALVMEALVKEPMQRTPSMERFGERVYEVAMLVGTPPTGAIGAPPSSVWHVPVYPPTPATPIPIAAPPPSGQPWARPPTPMPVSGRPPGVPQTVPPDGNAVRGRPPTPAPVAMPMPMPLAMPVPMPAPRPGTGPERPNSHGAWGMVQPAPPEPRRSRAPLWIALGVVVVGAGAGAGVLATRGHASSPAVAANHGSDPWALPEMPSGDDRHGGPEPWQAPAPEARDPDRPVSGETYRAPAGWGLVLPPGLPAQPQQDGEATIFSGLSEGRTIVVAVANVPLAAGKTDDELADDALELAQSMNGSLTSYDFPTFQGARRFRALIDVSGVRFEAVLFAETGGPSLVAMYGTEHGQFEAAEPARSEFFERRVLLPNAR